MNLEMSADREASLKVPCPIDLCGAEIGEVCVQLGTGQPLKHLPAHDTRLRAAGVRHAPLDSRELRGNPKRRSEARHAD